MVCINQVKRELAAATREAGPSSQLSEVLLTGLPVALLTDSYKAAHYAQYPAASKMVAYGSFRKAFKPREGSPPDPDDRRLVVYGIRYVVESYLHRRWTATDVEQAAAFYAHHNAGGTQYPFPRELFDSIVSDHGGYFPVKLEAIPDGSVVHAGCPIFQAGAPSSLLRWGGGVLPLPISPFLPADNRRSALRAPVHLP